MIGDLAPAINTEKELERRQRDRMEQLLEKVANVLPKLAGEEGWAGGEEGEPSRLGIGHPQAIHGGQLVSRMDTNAVIQGEYGARIATAVVKVAERVEKGIPRVVAASTTAPGRSSSSDSSTLPGACVLKQVRKAAGRMHSADLAPGALTASTKQQPHIQVAITPIGAPADSEWESAPSAPPKPSKGNMMVDTGAGITLVTKQWAEAHKLKISAPSAGKVYGAAGSEVAIVGTTAFTVQLTPTLEVDLANVSVSAGNFY